LTFAFGYKEDFRPYKSYNPKRKKIATAVELTKRGRIKQIHFKAIKNYSSKELRKLFDNHIDNGAHVIAEQWSGFDPLKKDFNIIQKPNSFKNFIQTNYIVHDLKTSLRSTYTSVKQKYLQYYLDEFSFKINHSKEKPYLFDLLIKRMIKHEPILLRNI
jgi:transposase-like protein